MKILIVEDEQRIRHLLKLYLEREDFNVVEVDNGDDALDQALNHEFALVILDVLLPGKNGIDVLKELREAKSTPVIMLTAKGEEKDLHIGYREGADDYIVKPFSPSQVVKRVKELLGIVK